MEYVIQGGQLLLSLSILIVLHEFGHYLPARWFNTRVEKFYLFFDYKFSLFKKKIKETEWGIGWIPLGGYVKISGMIDESMDKEQMALPPKDYEFRSKPAWQRLIIMIGGIVVNLIVGVVIYVMIMFTWGEEIVEPENVKYGFAVEEHFEQFGFQDGDQILTINGEKPDDVSRIGYDIALHGARDFEVQHSNGETELIALPEDIDMTMFEVGAMRGLEIRVLPIIDTVFKDGIADSAGFKSGDQITAVSNQTITYWDEFKEAINDSKSKSITATVLRSGREVELALLVDSTGTIGVMVDSKIDEIKKKIEYGFLSSIPRGIEAGWVTLSDYAKQFKYVFTTKGATSVGGFGAIGSLFDKEWNWRSFWSNTAFISIILAFMNFLPIPALDGGHIMFLMYEIISGRKPNDKFMEYAQMVGIIFLLALLVYANGNDIYKWITGG